MTTLSVLVCVLWAFKNTDLFLKKVRDLRGYLANTRLSHGRREAHGN